LTVCVHEAKGRGRAGFALFQAARRAGLIARMVLAHDRDRPMPRALRERVPERLHPTQTPADLPWSADEARRTRAVALVIAAPERPISLTAGRRLQLAA
jgi:protein ImuA